jgi:hypothetical protein
VVRCIHPREISVPVFVKLRAYPRGRAAAIEREYWRTEEREVQTMDVLVLLVMLIALAIISPLWGYDSREDLRPGEDYR